MRQVVVVVLTAVACGALAWCVWVLWSVGRDLRAAARRLAAERRDRDTGFIPDAEIDYDYVTPSDVRRMSDEQLRRGYEHALRRERAARERT